MKTSLLILTIFLGIVFSSAGIHRIFYKTQREYESRTLLGLPPYSDYIIIALEIGCGLCLFSGNDKAIYYSLMILLCMTIIGCILLVFRNKKRMIETYHELFTLKDTSMSVVLHATYILLICFVIHSIQAEKSINV